MSPDLTPAASRDESDAAADHAEPVPAEAIHSAPRVLAVAPVTLEAPPEVHPPVPAPAPGGALHSVLIASTSDTAPGPAPPVDQLAGWAVLGWTRRRFDVVEIDQTPQVASLAATAFSFAAADSGLDPVATVGLPNEYGVVEGVVTTNSISDYPLVYSGSGPTTSGYVQVSPDDGTFLYGPTNAARYSAAHGGPTQDSFTVTVDDLNGDTAGVVVEVPIAPNADPLGFAPTATVAAPDSAGVVTGTVSADPMVDIPVTYVGSTTTGKGTVVVNPDGTFTYTPTMQARQAAAAPRAAATGADVDSFVVTLVVPEQGEVASTVVIVAVSPTDQAAPTQTGGGVRAVVTEPVSVVPVVTVPPVVEPAAVTTDAVPGGGDPDGTSAVAAGRSGADPHRRSHEAEAGAAATPTAIPLANWLSGRGPAAATTPKDSGPLPFASVLPPAVVVNLQVALFALVSMLGGEAMLRGVGGLTVPANAGEPSGGRLAAVRAGKFQRATVDAALGDRSRTWRWPGTQRVDVALRTLAGRLAPHSPLLARVVVDGSAARAIFGSAAVSLPLVGVILAVLTLRETGGMSTPPSAWLLTAIAALGVFDALAGFFAVTVFITGVLVSGHLGSAADIRTLLGLSVIWFAVPIIAGAARPLRRSAARSIADWRAWLGDLVIASLIGAWAIQKMITALPGLAGTPLPIANHATLVALVILGACALRIVVEAAAARWYPGRLGEVQSGSLATPGVAQRIAAAGGRTALLMFIASAFLGMSWQLWVGGMLFLVPQLISVYEARLPNFPRLYRVYPRGIVKVVIMLVVGLGIAALVHRVVEHSAHPALDTFVLLSIPAAILSIVEVFGREGTAPEETWPRWMAGAGFVAAGVWLVLFVM